MRVSETKLRVRYDETNKYGIAHHSNVVKWFDIALLELLRQNGMTYTELEAKGLLFSIVESRCRFIKPIYADDVIVISTSIKAISSIKCEFVYEMTQEGDGVRVATGESAHVFVDTNMRPVSIKARHPEIFEILKRYINASGE